MYNVTSQRSPSGYFTFVVIAGFRQMKILNKETDWSKVSNSQGTQNAETAT